ncbi:PiggyBac transposable element-derived protein 4 [Blattella germanica]|nr:PiggyBac transposable element-derived protein 4 [Blattella germanica]
MDRGAPKELKNELKNLKKGESKFSRKGQVLVQVWKDKRDVKLISTLHTAQIVESEKTNRKGEKISRPMMIGEYNKHMKGVDRADQMLHYYPCSRKTVKWTKKLVFFMLQMAMLNSFALFKKTTTLEKFKRRKYLFKDFIMECVEKMTEENKHNEGEDFNSEDESMTSNSTVPTPPPATWKRPPMKDPANRLEGGLKIHKMVHVPPSNNKKNGAVRKCRVCGKHKLRKETSVMCVSCGVALCRLPCFNNYHTKKSY